MGLLDTLTAQTPQGEQIRSGLLGLGMGLLGGSTGHYGQFAPALAMGLGGMQRGMQDTRENQMREQQLAQAQAFRDLQARQLQGEIAQQEGFRNFFTGGGSGGAQSFPAGQASGNAAGALNDRIQQAINSGNPALMDWGFKALGATKGTTRTQYDPNTGMLIDLNAGTASPVMGPGGPVGAKKERVWDSARGGFIDKNTNEFTPAIGPDGNPVPAQNILEKPMTEAQSKDLLFGSRAREATKVIDDFMASKPSWWQQAGTAAAGYDAPGFLGPLGGIIETGLNTVATSDAQKFNQAQRDFVNAVLRKESGAVISDEEFDNARKQYFPMPGDSAEVIAQKKANRDLAVQGILMGAPAGQRNSLQPTQQGRPSLSDIFGN